MDILLNPNIAYLLIVAATFLVLVAIITPGTGIPEIGALFTIVLAGYAVYHLSFNWWALVLLGLSLIPFWIAVRKPGHWLWLALSILGLTAGSVFFFPAEAGPISVNPVLAILTSALYAAFVWIAARKVMQAGQSRPAHDLSALIGQQGEAKTDIREEGSVQVAGELWSARSQVKVPAGNLVRVVGREGFVLVVESDQHNR
jgi:membrane-bound serine protease (ClpP class)